MILTPRRIFNRLLFEIVMTVFSLMSIGPRATAQTYLFNQGNFATGSYPQSIAVGDFNRDGKPDLVVVNNIDNTVSILLGKADGTFQPHVDYPVGALPSSAAIGDFNGDGKLDLAVTLSQSATIAILLGNGDGTFGSPSTFALGGNGHAVIAGDFNNDGNLDLAVMVATGSGFTGAASVLLGNGDGTFQPYADFPLPYAPGMAVAADLDNDGKLDLIVATESSNAFTVLLGNGDGTFQPFVNYPVNGVLGQLVVGDFNGDGNPDVVVPSSAAGQSGALIFLGKGDGTFQPSVPIAAGGESVGAMVAGDFNGDGKLDIAFTTTDFTAGVIDVLVGNGNGTFQSQPLFGGAGTGSLATGDFNGDGKLDLAFTGTSVTTSIGVLLGNGDATFNPRVDYTTSAAPIGAITGDFNGDGKQDLAVVNITTQFSPGTVSIFIGNGDGTFQSSVDYAVGDYPQYIITGDFNGDGKLDLAVVNSGSTLGQGSVSILLGNGDGTFQPHGDYDVGIASSGLVAGDFNGDGKLDLAVASGNAYPSPNRAAVAILLGNGNGTFQAASLISIVGSSASAYGITAADFNHDGALDLAITDSNSYVYVLLGKGNGSFASPTAYLVPWGPTAIAASDFNGDGNVDLAVTQQSSGSFSYVSIMLGNGDGTFQTSVPYTTGNFPGSIAIGDFNGDGHLDIATANVNSNTASILLGKGDGTFPARCDFAAPGLYPLGVAAGDFNGDGIADLVIANGYSDSVSIYLSHPVIALDPSRILFAPEAAGSTSPAQTVTVSNPGSAPLSISGLAAAGPFPQTNTCGPMLAIGADCTVSVSFSPSGPGQATGAIAFTDNTLGPPQAILLSGIGFSGPGIVLSPPSLSFTDQEVTTTSAAETVTLTNDGTAVLGITTVVASGDFAQTNNCVGSIDPGDNCTISVTFTPTVIGKRSGTITITDNAWSNPQTVALAGKGVGPVASLSASSLTFGNEAVGTTSAAQTVVVNNNGHSPLSITLVSTTGDFAEINTCSGPVAPNSSCTISVTFSPLTGGTLAGSLSITSNATNSPSVIPLTGTGLAPRVGVYLLTLYFPDQLVGVTSASEPVKVTNIGSLPLIFSSISTTGDFAQTNTCTGAVAPLATCTVNVTFTPTVLGAESGTLTFTDNAPGSSPVVNLSGSGTNTYSAPWISQILPPEAVAGGPAFTLTVNGTGFGPASVVNWNGSPRTTTMVNGGQLTAAIKASDIATGGTSLITVVNPSPAGASLSPAGFDVFNPSPSLQFSRTDLAVGQGPEYMAWGDFNGDGKVDLAVPNDTDGTVSVLLGKGDGTFQPEVTYATGFSPYAVVTGDFNHDGKPDLAVTNLGCLPSGNCYPGSASVSILLGNGDGTFGQATALNTNSLVTSLATADFNGDGRLDLVVGASGTSGSEIVIYLGNGDGTFQAGATYPVGGSGVPGSIVVADYNGDGKLDLAVANGYSSNGVSILLGNGDGTFQSAVQYATGLSPQSIATADFNGDGKLDLVVANADPTENTVSILLGNGDGTFRPHTDYSTGVGPASVTTGDFNGDGKLDLAVADSESNTVSILLGNGDGTFQANHDFVVGATPVSVLARDFNGDGRLDLAVTNWGSNTVSVLLQTLAGVSLSSTSVSFGNQATGAASSAQSVTLGNTGTGILNISSIAFTGPNGGDFGQINNCGTSVASGAKCAIAVTFTPKGVGAETGTLTITDNAAGSPHTVALTGTGVGPAGALSPASLTFPAQMDNTPSTAQVVTLANSGNAVLAITSVVASGDFAETNTCGPSLAAGANCAINVTFTPTGGGARSGTLTVTDNSSGVAGSTQIVALNGTGQDFAFAPPSGSSTSASVSPGSPATYTLSVGGEGGLSGQVTFTCTGAPSEATCTVSPNPVTAGSSATNVTVTVTTTASSVSAPRSHPSPPASPLTPVLRGLLMLTLVLAAMAWAIIRWNQPGVSGWQSTLLPLASGVLLALALVGCGGGGGGTTSNPGTPAGTYTLTVTGTTGTGSSALSHSVTLKLTVS